MTAPNEPGIPGPDGGPVNAEGPTDFAGQPLASRPATGRIAEVGEVAPPRQRAASRPRAAAPRAPEPPPHRETEPPPHPENAAAGHSPGVDARLRRFVSAGAAPGAQRGQADVVAGEPGAGRNESYGSELPDLSEPASRAAQPMSATRRTQPPSRAPGPLRASMQIRRIDPWSALKVSLLLSVALFFVWMFAVAFLYLVLGAMGVWSKLNSNVGDLLTNTSGAGELVSAGSIFGGATLIGLVNIVLLTAMATLGAVIYNVSTDVVGGVEVTLADRD